MGINMGRHHLLSSSELFLTELFLLPLDVITIIPNDELTADPM